MAQGQIRLDPRLLEDALHLPEGMVVVGFKRHPVRPTDLVLIVQHPDIPEVEGIADLPELKLTYHRDHFDVTTLESWGVWDLGGAYG